MAENKKGFLLYADILPTIEKLSKTENGKEKVCELFITILEYVNDKNPEPRDPMVDITFEPIKQQLKRDLKKYERRAERSKENGKQGGRPKENPDEPRKPSGLLINPENPDEPRKPDTVKDNGNGSDNGSVKDIPKSVVEVFFNDLPGSSHFENIARVLVVPKDQLLLFIPAFKKKAELTYPSFDRFCNHFKNWVSIELRNQKPATTQGPKKLGA